MKLYSIGSLAFWYAADDGEQDLLDKSGDGRHGIVHFENVGPAREPLPRNWEFCYEIDMTDI
jgi:hypothetical protein